MLIKVGLSIIVWYSKISIFPEATQNKIILFDSAKFLLFWVKYKRESLYVFKVVYIFTYCFVFRKLHTRDNIMYKEYGKLFHYLLVQNIIALFNIIIFFLIRNYKLSSNDHNGRLYVLCILTFIKFSLGISFVTTFTYILND